MEKALLLYWWQRFAGLRSLGKLGGPPRHTEATVRYTQGVRALMKTGGHAVSVQGGLWHQKDPRGHKAPEGKASRGGGAPARTGSLQLRASVWMELCYRSHHAAPGL